MHAHLRCTIALVLVELRRPFLADAYVVCLMFGDVWKDLDDEEHVAYLFSISAIEIFRATPL